MPGCRPLSREEFLACMDAFRGRYKLRNRALMAMGYYTGFRISECLSLRLKDVVQYNEIVNEIRVERRNMKGKKSGREVPVPQALKLELAPWINELSSKGYLAPDSYLFQSNAPGNRAIHRSTADRVYKRVFRGLRLRGKLATHSMRKAFGERLYQRLGENLLKTQTALGHKDVNSTTKYLKVDQDEVNQAILEG